MDPALLNCLMEICCNEPLRALRALTTFYVKYCGMAEEPAKQAAEGTHKYFDLAEKGTLKPFKDSIARLARGADYKE